jgi:hypothetical protein
MGMINSACLCSSFQIANIKVMTTKFLAVAHNRCGYNYSAFHCSLLHEDSAGNAALPHLYSLENTKISLDGWNWSSEEIKKGMDHATIEVYEHVVYLHIPNHFNKRNGDRILIKGISRFISKADYVEVLLKRAWAKADPYKLQPGTSWDELIAMGNTGDFYSIGLQESKITCTCHAYSGLEKAFEQDTTAAKYLINNPALEGQLPDKHVFSAWKYLNAETIQHYKYSWKERNERFAEMNH